MKRLLSAVIFVVVGLLFAGCASTQTAYIEAQKSALVREADARVAEAQAIAAVAGRLDAGGAAAYAVMVANRNAVQSAAAAAKIERPRDWLDYAQGVANIVGVIGQVAVPIASIRASRDVAIAGYNRDVGVATAAQAGETARTNAITGMASQVATAPRAPTTQINVTSGRDAVVGSGSINNSDNRNCSTNAGNGAPGTGTLASVSTTLPAIQLLPAAGGAGGAAIGGC